jgi:hypothetical protein
MLLEPPFFLWKPPQMAAATRRTVLNATNLLTATPLEAAIIIACALTDPGDLLHLAVALPQRFAIKCIGAAASSHRTTASSGTAAAATAGAPDLWSIGEEAARRWIAGCTDQERGWVPRRGRESWLGLMWEVQSLRRGAVFGRSHESITLSEGGSRATVRAVQYYYLTTASKAVMRAGRHYAQFTLMSGGYNIIVGVIRPSWNVEGGRNAPWVDSHCFHDTDDGHRYPGPHDWEGRQDALEGDRIGVLLDLDQGSMTVYKNDKRLGVMATGLSSEYCWAVTLMNSGNSADRSCSARIESANIPPAPSADELGDVLTHVAA